MEQSPSPLGIILTFISTLIWPGIFIWLILTFRPQVEQLLRRLAKAKVAGAELEFQPSVADAAPPIHDAKVEISQIGTDGFFTAEGIRTIVTQSGLLPRGEAAHAEVLFFESAEQHTWAVASASRMVIVLDDENTRARDRLIQIILNKTNAVPLTFRTNASSRLVRFGADPHWWYYSQSLFGTTAIFEKQFQQLLAR